MEIGGTELHSPNYRFRLYLIIVCGIAALGIATYWRAQVLLAAQYVEFPEGSAVAKARQNRLETQKAPPTKSKTIINKK